MNIYILKLSKYMSNETIYELSKFISLDKKNIIDKFSKNKDKIRCLFSSLLIRSILMNNYCMKNDEIIFEKNQYGKPLIKGKNNINFNISHSGDYIVCCIDMNKVGIDIEKIKEVDYSDMIKRFFTVPECNYIFKNENSSEKNNSLDKFYTMWTLKESFLKCIGVGLTVPLKSFSIIINKNDKITVSKSNDKEIFSFNIINFNNEYKMSVCCLNTKLDIHLHYINQENIINQFLSLK